MMPQRVIQWEDHEDLVQRAIGAIKAGRKAEGRELLREACKGDPGNLKAWLWRASVAESALEAVA